MLNTQQTVHIEGDLDGMPLETARSWKTSSHCAQGSHARQSALVQKVVEVADIVGYDAKLNGVVATGMEAPPQQAPVSENVSKNVT